MQNHARVGGILSIVAGAFGVFWLAVAALFVFLMFFSYPGMHYYDGYDGYMMGGFSYFWVLFIFWCLVLVLLGVLAIIGGIFAIRKKLWGLALAGAIAGAIVFLPCGVAAIIFIALGKQEFNVLQQPVTGAVST